MKVIKGGVDVAEHNALREIKITPFIMPSLDEAVIVDKVSNATILRTIQFNVEQWRDAAREYASIEPSHWYGRVDAYNKVIELIENIKGSLR